MLHVSTRSNFFLLRSYVNMFFLHWCVFPWADCHCVFYESLAEAGGGESSQLPSGWFPVSQPPRLAGAASGQSTTSVHSCLFLSYSTLLFKITPYKSSCLYCLQWTVILISHCPETLPLRVWSSWGVRPAAKYHQKIRRTPKNRHRSGK